MLETLGKGDGPGGGEAGAVGVQDQGGMTLNTRATTLARSAVLTSMHDRWDRLQAIPDTVRTG